MGGEGVSLFRTGSFSLASGESSRWKIDCDALTDDDWKALAVMAVEMLAPFQSVYGVPSGGCPFELALAKYETGRRDDPVLIVDDVWTTGGSWRRFRDQYLPGAVHGCVVFARRPIDQPGVKALFTFAESPQ